MKIGNHSHQYNDLINRIQKFDSDGGFITQWDSNGTEGIAIDSQGYAYVTDRKNNRIQVWAPSAAFICSIRKEILSSIICCKVIVVTISLSITGEAKLQMVHYKMAGTKRRGGCPINNNKCYQVNN